MPIPNFKGTKEDDASNESEDWMNVSYDSRSNVGRDGIAYSATAEARELVKTDSSGNFQVKYYINKGGSAGTFGYGSAYYDSGTSVYAGYSNDTSATTYTQINSQSFDSGDYIDGSGSSRGQPISYDRGNRENFKLNVSVVTNVDWRDQGTQCEAYTTSVHNYQVKFIENNIIIIENNPSDRLLLVLPSTTGKLFFIKNATGNNDKVFIIGGYGEAIDGKNFIRLGGYACVGLSRHSTSSATGWSIITYTEVDDGKSTNNFRRGKWDYSSSNTEINSEVVIVNTTSTNHPMINLPDPATFTKKIICVCNVGTHYVDVHTNGKLYEVQDSRAFIRIEPVSSSNCSAAIFLKGASNWYMAAYWKGDGSTAYADTETATNTLTGAFAFVSPTSDCIYTIPTLTTTSNKVSLGFVKVKNRASTRLRIQHPNDNLGSSSNNGVDLVGDNTALLYVSGNFTIGGTARQGFALAAVYPPWD